MTALHSIEAEQSVLGCLLNDGSRIGEVADLIGARSFGHWPYGLVFSAIAELVARHETPDVVAVFERLQVAGKADQVGGLVHLNELAQSVASASGVVRYARLVADRAKRRTLIDIAEDLPALVAGADSADAALDALQTKLGQLQRSAARGEPKALAAHVLAAVDELSAIANGEAAAGWSTGLPAIDKALGGGLKPGRVLVLAARTSVGKTSLAVQILLHLAANGHPGLMLSQEMTGPELAVRALAHQGHIGMDRLAVAELDDSDWQALPGAADHLSALPLWIDDQAGLRLIDIAAKARAVQRQHGLHVLVIDYLQLCAAEQVKGQSRHHQIEAISRGIKTLAKELGIAVLLLSQLNRAAEDGEPELHHLKESGAVEEDADTVLLLHPMGNEPDGSQTVCCKVAKNRGGKRGRLALAFDGRHQRWRCSTANVARATREGGKRTHQ